MKPKRPSDKSKLTRVEDGLPTVDESIYDHPKYYDLVFGADVAAETRFILDCCRKFLDREPELFFEPACGTGRLLYSLAKRGHDVCGLDLNDKAVQFCNRRLSRHGFAESAIVADMCEFGRQDFRGALPTGLRRRLSRKAGPASVAFNTINSFRHVDTEKRAVSHLDCVADVIHPGGLYLLGVHLTPTRIPPSETESWSARRGHLAISTHMWTIHRDRRKRLERFGIRFDVHTPSQSFRISDELRLRSYTPKQMNQLITASGKWNVITAYDFSYDINEPIEIDNTTEDVVYVLQRR